MDKAQLPVNAELSLGVDTQDIKPTSKAEAIEASIVFGASPTVTVWDLAEVEAFIAQRAGGAAK